MIFGYRLNRFLPGAVMESHRCAVSREMKRDPLALETNNICG